MTRFVGLDVLQKLTATCVLDDTGRRLCEAHQTTDGSSGACGTSCCVVVRVRPPWRIQRRRRFILLFRYHGAQA
jgi:hypothetical protein